MMQQLMDTPGGAEQSRMTRDTADHIRVVIMNPPGQQDIPPGAEFRRRHGFTAARPPPLRGKNRRSMESGA